MDQRIAKTIAALVIVFFLTLAFAWLTGCTPSGEASHQVDTVYVPTPVNVPAKLEYVMNRNRKFGSALEYWHIRTDSLDLLFTGVEIYNGRKRAAENKEDLPK